MSSQRLPYYGHADDYAPQTTKLSPNQSSSTRISPQLLQSLPLRRAKSEGSKEQLIRAKVIWALQLLPSLVMSLLPNLMQQQAVTSTTPALHLHIMKHTQSN